MVEKVLAALVAGVCVLLLLRLCLGARRQRRFDAAARQAWANVRHGTVRLRHWRSDRRAAERAAEEAIERARSGVQRDGNVYRPKSFRGPRKPH